MKRALTGFIGLMLLAACESQPTAAVETQHADNIRWDIVAASEQAFYLPIRTQ